jgi:hypothetical protein
MFQFVYILRAGRSPTAPSGHMALCKTTARSLSAQTHFQVWTEDSSYKSLTNCSVLRSTCHFAVCIQPLPHTFSRGQRTAFVQLLVTSQRSPRSAVFHSTRVLSAFSAVLPRAVLEQCFHINVSLCSVL